MGTPAPVIAGQGTDWEQDLEYPTARIFAGAPYLIPEKAGLLRFLPLPESCRTINALRIPNTVSEKKMPRFALRNALECIPGIPKVHDVRISRLVHKP